MHTADIPTQSYIEMLLNVRQFLAEGQYNQVPQVGDYPSQIPFN